MELLSRDAINYTVGGHSLADLPNYHEQAVLDLLRELYASDDPPCGCSICVEDSYALALNSLPPRYIQSTSVNSYLSSVNFIPPEVVRAKVLEAVEKVRTRPNH
ncbi:MAG: late competence development ComFB family protein [Deferrisomatales bacterium]|nr:late competence development ComFB family protein [Deferrisomatales bacterium]